ncbi:MAG: YdbH domain-containing protein [Phenylobacterium sp.]|uniref:intermembrane phospholipid transport protein YdbH family protein n=1 Tax=Phenylobacterium sp. TaxID=1871053 RepID=UPI0027362E18|nr:YdbH domain-containing protein [Phenylobacterium sp.]MDP3173096.1 YdbH domain-containing protein [Phenylobacterium sp.]
MLAVCLLVALALIAVWAARRAIAREALIGWLHSHGVEADARVEAFGLNGFTGAVTAGPSSDPDFAAERAEISYGLAGPWSGRPLGLDVSSVRLVRPVLKARWRNGKLSAGALDPLIAEFTRKPPRPDARQPKVTIENGTLRLDTDYGVVRLNADARLEDGKLLALDARLAQAALRGPAGSAAAGPGRLTLNTRGDRVALALDLPLTRLEVAQTRLDDARLRIAGDLPYPDFKRRRGDGRVTLTMNGEAATLTSSGASLKGAKLEGRFDGVAAGWIETLTLNGQAALMAHAVSAAQGDLQIGPAKVDLRAETATWSRRGGDQLTARMTVKALVDSLRSGDARLRSLTADLQGAGEWRAQGPVRLDLIGSAASAGALTSLGRVEAKDMPQIAALKRGLADFRAIAPGVRITLEDGLRVALSQPARIAGAGGMTVIVSPSHSQPLIEPDGGAFEALASGGGFPRVALTGGRWRTVNGGVAIDGGLTAQGDFGPLQSFSTQSDVALRVIGPTATLATGGCLPIRAKHLELGENDLEDLSFSLCPSGGPLVTARGGDWRTNAAVRALRARAPFLEARFEDAAGPLSFGIAKGVMRGRFDVRGARITDLASVRRFSPLRAAGVAGVAGDIWSAKLTLSDGANRDLGVAELRHDVSQGVGRVVLDAADLVFAEGGLQPAELSPLASVIGSPARGRAHFSGGFDWTTAGTASQGFLEIDELDFQSPAGPVTGLSGDITFSSLAPLETPPGQALSVQRIAVASGLTDLRMGFALTPDALRVDGATANLAGGVISAEAFTLPLRPDAPWGGTLSLKDVQLSDLVEASPFADRMDLQAKVDGRIPFTVIKDGFRISQGELHAIEPGKLSLKREALTGVAATTQAAPDAPAPNAFTDFAYQAMEHLTFTELSARIDSLPQGRIGVVLRVKGEHQPPTHQEIRISAADLIRNKFLERELPLPSGTKVDLTLDTSLNLDQLLGDYAGYQQLRGSAAVQPAPANTAPGPSETTTP